MSRLTKKQQKRAARSASVRSERFNVKSCLETGLPQNHPFFKTHRSSMTPMEDLRNLKIMYGKKLKGRNKRDTSFDREQQKMMEELLKAKEFELDDEKGPALTVHESMQKYLFDYK